MATTILSRLPVGRVRRHALPWPPSAEHRSMPRVAVEAVIEAPTGSVRVTTRPGQVRVENTGPAIAADDVRRLAEPFELTLTCAVLDTEAVTVA